MNIFKTMILMAAMTALFLFVGSLVGGSAGLVVALLLSGVMGFVSYWFSDKIVLMMYSAKEVTREEEPRLHAMIEKLSQRAGLPMPRVYVIPSESPNAFATGRNHTHSAVAVTQGLRRLLNDRELEGVLAHELAHVKHYDILIGTIVGIIAGTISSVASIVRWGMIFGGFGGRSDDEEGGGGLALIVLAIVAPIIALLIQMAVSRSREYHADESAGELTGDPMALAAALERIHAGIEMRPMPNAGPATAHLFISSPLSGKGFFTLFSTHPAMEDRVQKLAEQARRMGKIP